MVFTIDINFPKADVHVYIYITIHTVFQAGPTHHKSSCPGVLGPTWKKLRYIWYCIFKLTRWGPSNVDGPALHTVAYIMYPTRVPISSNSVFLHFHRQVFPPYFKTTVFGWQSKRLKEASILTVVQAWRCWRAWKDKTSIALRGLGDQGMWLCAFPSTSGKSCCPFPGHTCTAYYP